MEWAELLVKHKDIFEKTLIDIKIEGNRMFVEKEKSYEVYISVGELPIANFVSDIANFGADITHIWFVLSNTKKSIDNVVDSWTSLSSDTRIRIWFVGLSNGKKWAVNPHIHSLITPVKKLKSSLSSLSRSI